MSREVHVRFYEQRRGKFPPLTLRVMVFKRLDDAQRVLEVLSKRFEKYGLSIHPEKTRLVDFRHPWNSGKKPETFDFLGFSASSKGWRVQWDTGPPG